MLSVQMDENIEVLERCPKQLLGRKMLDTKLKTKWLHIPTLAVLLSISESPIVRLVSMLPASLAKSRSLWKTGGEGAEELAEVQGENRGWS